VCPDPARVRLEFEIGGGTDCPYIGLTLRIRGVDAGLNNERETTMHVRYYGWAPGVAPVLQHKGDQEGRFRPTIRLGESAPNTKMSFSRRLYDVEFDARRQIPNDMHDCLTQVKWASNRQLMFFRWSALDPICIGFGQFLDGFPDDCVEAAEKFKLLVWREHTVEAYLRGQEGIV
jgi:hypothetical protein